MRLRADPNQGGTASLQFMGLGAVAFMPLFTREQIYPRRIAKCPKLFPISKVEFQPNSTIKLTKKKIELIILQKEKTESSEVIAKIQNITRRRRVQLWQQYRDTGTIPIIGQTIGQPKKSITIEESITIDQAYQQYRYGAQMLEILFRKEYGIFVPYKQDS